MLKAGRRNLQPGFLQPVPDLQESQFKNVQDRPVQLGLHMIIGKLQCPPVALCLLYEFLCPYLVLSLR